MPETFLPELLLAVSIAIVIITLRYGLLEGLIATWIAYLTGKTWFGIVVYPHSKLTRNIRVLFGLMHADLTLDDPSSRSLCILLTSVALACAYPTVPSEVKWCSRVLLAVWALIYCLSSWGFFAVVAIGSSLGYLISAWFTGARLYITFADNRGP